MLAVLASARGPGQDVDEEEDEDNDDTMMMTIMMAAPNTAMAIFKPSLTLLITTGDGKPCQPITQPPPPAPR